MFIARYEASIFLKHRFSYLHGKRAKTLKSHPLEKKISDLPKIFDNRDKNVKIGEIERLNIKKALPDMKRVFFMHYFGILDVLQEFLRESMITSVSTTTE
ncbi:hypothetical protein ACFRAM_23175 [Paenibacillus sp. NPDC056722]|uniref:hypothetical protein n=1 Tax=Paenibacillus sp. NPDC056722 TaxID=3345924 RepID=UPI003686E5C9